AGPARATARREAQSVLRCRSYLTPDTFQPFQRIPAADFSTRRASPVDPSPSLFFLGDASVKQVNDVIGVTRVVWAVGHHADGRAAAVKFMQQFHHGVAVRGVEVAR